MLHLQSLVAFACSYRGHFVPHTSRLKEKNYCLISYFTINHEAYYLLQTLTKRTEPPWHDVPLYVV